jgi:hypothetical protein
VLLSDADSTDARYACLTGRCEFVEGSLGSKIERARLKERHGRLEPELFRDSRHRKRPETRLATARRVTGRVVFLLAAGVRQGVLGLGLLVVLGAHKDNRLVVRVLPDLGAEFSRKAKKWRVGRILRSSFSKSASHIFSDDTITYISVTG